MAIEEMCADSEDPVNLAKMAIAEGSFTADQFEKLVDACRESLSPSRYFRGSYVQLLRSNALRLAGEHKARLEDIPIAFLPTRLLNAAAFPTPRGGAAIILDGGVALQLAFLVRSYLAWRFWYGVEPYCRDHSQDEFALTIVRLAHFSVTGDIRHLRAITTEECPSLPVHDESLELLGTEIELFIVLHEFGHIVMNHLGSIRSIRLGAEPARDVAIYIREGTRRRYRPRISIWSTTSGTSMNLYSF